jgi:hypothetical protein
VEQSHAKRGRAGCDQKRAQQKIVQPTSPALEALNRAAPTSASRQQCGQKYARQRYDEALRSDIAQQRRTIARHRNVCLEQCVDQTHAQDGVNDYADRGFERDISNMLASHRPGELQRSHSAPS